MQTKKGLNTLYSTVTNSHFGSLFYVVKLCANHSGRTASGMNRLRPLDHWDHGFEYDSRHVCLCAFILCLC
jgi:hypothetical protein